MSDDVNPASADYQFGRVISKLESIEDTMSQQHTEIMTRAETQEKRISSLEKWKARATGAFAVITTMGGALLAWVHDTGR
jgi:hypothetical protein